ncbi:MAG TPA: diguanylate cyclase [Solirubrobacteraceae bacterium]|nr:diguanylate cyclase [Solirubrobacteraceae bacterium]
MRSTQILDSRSRVLRAALALGALGVAFLVAHSLFHLGGRSLEGFANEGVYTFVELVACAVCVARGLRRRENRAAWLVLGAGLIAWTAGDFTWTVWLSHVAKPPYPSPADGMYLAMYPCIYACLILLIRSRHSHVGAGAWLDGAVVGLTTAAISAAFVFPPVLAAAKGDAAAVGVNLAYPLADFLLVVFLAMGFALAGWRPGRQWWVLGAGVALMTVADMIYVYELAKETYGEGGVLESLWPAAMMLMALAAWQPMPRVVRRESAGRQAIALPAGFVLLALALLLSGLVRALTPLSVALAACALLAAWARAALTHIENARMLKLRTHDAVTDALTGLANRRKLLGDLQAALARGADGASTLAFFDLDGFKRYNDTYGHSAGDALLERLGRTLAGTVQHSGRAYRLGGDEFCVLLSGRVGPADAILRAARAALTEQGSGFSVTTSCGVVLLPDEAENTSTALSLADERMYADKSAGHRSARAQAQTVATQQNLLMQLLAEREPRLRSHLRDVGALATEIGRELGLSGEQIDELHRAAELHDLGKIAIPEAVLNKPGPLSDSEWILMRQHTIIGERILNAAPALRPVAKLVRSTHERWDGAGYPDALGGERIPLGARIIFVCDAFDAMTTQRPYGTPKTHDDALAELERNAGTQFDPRVVEAFCGCMRAQPDARRVRQRRPAGRVRTRAAAPAR